MRITSYFCHFYDTFVAIFGKLSLMTSLNFLFSLRFLFLSDLTICWSGILSVTRNPRILHQQMVAPHNIKPQSHFPNNPSYTLITIVTKL